MGHNQDWGRDHTGPAGFEGERAGSLTHFISRSVKMRVSTTMRSGTVRMRMKGKAREAAVDMTAQSRARQSSCRAVNRCILRVRTWRQAGWGETRSPGFPTTEGRSHPED